MSVEHDASAGAGAVVVGVDGSEHARVALERALAEGARLGARVTAVAAYDPPDLWAVELGALAPDLAEVGSEVRALLHKAVDEAVAEARAGGVDVPDVQLVVAAGSAADVLCRVGRDAELLVVGHRGRGALATRLIGSVGLGVVVHAACPILVVRAPEAVAAAGSCVAGSPKLSRDHTQHLADIVATCHRSSTTFRSMFGGFLSATTLGLTPRLDDQTSASGGAGPADRANRRAKRRPCFGRLCRASAF